MSSFDDAFRPRDPSPKNAQGSVQSSLWRNLRFLYPNKSQAGEIAWLLVRAGQQNPDAVAALSRRRQSEISALRDVVVKTRDSKTGAGNHGWSSLCSNIMGALSSLAASPSPGGSAPPAPVTGVRPVLDEDAAFESKLARIAELRAAGKTSEEIGVIIMVESP